MRFDQATATVPATEQPVAQPCELGSCGCRQPCVTGYASLTDGADSESRLGVKSGREPVSSARREDRRVPFPLPMVSPISPAQPEILDSRPGADAAPGLLPTSCRNAPTSPRSSSSAPGRSSSARPASSTIPGRRRQGAEGRGLPRRPGQLQPGDDHDRSRSRRRHLYRADHARRSSPRSSSKRAARTTLAAADDGRPDGAELRAGAAQAGRPRRNTASR